MHYNIIIIGAGISSISAIKSIRETDSTSSILLVSNEDRLPYKRTKINKLICEGFSKNDFALFPAEYYKENNVDIIYDEVTEIKANENMVQLQNTGPALFDKLLIATGKKPKEIDIKNIPKNLTFHIYTALDSENFIEKMKGFSNFLVIGGGVEGFEMADQILQMGKRATIIHNAPFVMNQQLTKPASEKLEAIATEKGVKIIKDSDVTSHLTFNNNIAYSSPFHSESYDAIVLCIGSLPNMHLAEKAGIEVNGGIIVNEYFQTSQPNIYAAGDVATLPDSTNSHLWHQAEEQGRVAGKNIAGLSVKYTPKSFRLKTDVFNNFFYSQNRPRQLSGFSVITESKGNLYREIFIKDDKIHGIVMINDKSRSKIYEKAIWEGWTLNQLQKQLPF